MLEQLAQAVQNEDFITANELLGDLQQNEPTNPWIGFYLARLQEAEGNEEDAKTAYLTILRTSTHPKIIAQSRQGIQRIEQREKNQVQAEQTEIQSAITEAMETPDNQKMGLLILEPIETEDKKPFAQEFAKIMGIDAYSARLKLPSRAWRLYTTGGMGKLNVYADMLKKAQIPCFTASLEEIKRLQVYTVLFIESIEPQVTLVYEPSKGQRDILSFPWSEVSQSVEGMLPIFEECVERGARGQLQRKTKILDYAKFRDLHLPKHQMILRFCDQTYQFQQGYSIVSGMENVEEKNTTQDYWNHFNRFMAEKLGDKPLYSEFTPFGETAIDFRELLKQIEPNINLLRREETPWDAAFTLYSGLAFIKNGSI